MSKTATRPGCLETFGASSPHQEIVGKVVLNAKTSREVMRAVRPVVGEVWVGGFFESL